MVFLPKQHRRNVSSRVSQPTKGPPLGFRRAPFHPFNRGVDVVALGRSEDRTCRKLPRPIRPLWLHTESIGDVCNISLLRGGHVRGGGGTKPCSMRHGGPSTRLSPTASLTTMLGTRKVSLVVVPAGPPHMEQHALPPKTSLQRFCKRLLMPHSLALLAWVAPLAHRRQLRKSTGSMPFSSPLESERRSATRIRTE